MLELEEFPTSKRVSVPELKEAIDGLFRFPTGPLSHHRKKLVMYIHSRLRQAKKTFSQLEIEIENCQETLDFPGDAKNAKSFAAETIRVADWYIQTVGNIFYNYLKGTDEAIESSGGLNEVSLRILNKIGHNTRQSTSYVLLSSFDKVTADLHIEDELSAAIAKFAILDHCSRVPYDLWVVVNAMLATIEEHGVLQELSISEVADLNEYREKRRLGALAGTTEEVLIQIINAFAYLRIREVL